MFVRILLFALYLFRCGCAELHSAQFAVPDEQMELIVARSDRVLVALFHDVTNPAVVRILHMENESVTMACAYQFASFSSVRNYASMPGKQLSV